MKIGITCGGIGIYGSRDFLRRSVQAAERAGFTAYLMPEHVVQFAVYPESPYPYAGGSNQEVPESSVEASFKFDDAVNPQQDAKNDLVDPVITMAWLAALTTKIEVGTNILVLPQRNPVILAKALATLDALSDGRVLLGVGVGWAKEEFEACGADFHVRGKRTDEAIKIMRELWLKEVSSYSGKFFTFKDAYSYPKPARQIPVLIGGESDAALRRAAELGDGWLPYNLTPDQAGPAIKKLKDLTRTAGRDPAKLRICKIVYSVATMDDLKRYRDAGVTEFNMASNGEIPLDATGLEAKFREFQDKVVGPVGTL